MSKNYGLTIFSIVLLIISMVYFFNKNVNSTSQSYVKIDTINQSHIIYEDSVVKVKKYIVDSFSVHKDKVDTLFFNSDSTTRHKIIDSVLKVDSIPRKYAISDSQAIRIIRITDSLPLLDTLYKIESVRVDSANNVIVNLNHNLEYVINNSKLEINKNKIKYSSFGFIGGFIVAGVITLILGVTN